MKTIALAVVSFLLITAAVGAEQSDDVLGRILAEVGFTRADLGYNPAGYWNRFPLDIPYRLTSFDDLFAEPLKLYDYSTVMANTVETYMDPTYADSADNGLYKLVYNLGVDKKLGGFRSYDANLLPAPEGPQPLVTAITAINDIAGAPTDTAEIAETIKALPDTIQTVISQLLVNLADAIKWRNLAFRNCDPDDMARTIEIGDLAISQEDGLVYYPELDDIAATIDFPSLHYAALKVAAAAEQAERTLVPFADNLPKNLLIDIPTPYGRIYICSARPNAEGGIQLRGNGLFTYINDVDNTLLVIDFGSDLIYGGTPGATASLDNPVSVVIDLGGNDSYGFESGSGDHTLPPSAGVGLCGIGLVIDSEGDDTYTGGVYAQGAGLFGVGVLLDREGDDTYKAELSAQGCGYFGIGLCLDISGDDKYYLYSDGQGLGGVGGGIGVCGSFDGNDEYVAEKDPAVFDRADYHSQHKINSNWVQGAGKGRRGDLTDGHSWAGGLGAIIDIHGDDYYFSGNWSLGIAYWFSTGIAVDREGDDIYESCYFTQASGAHYCSAILLDESGNDVHKLYETAGAALGFGWDFTNAMLINMGGNDTYNANMISMGLAQIRSNAFLIDIGGDDSYTLGEGTPGLGEASFREGYDKPMPLITYYYYAKSFGGFIDIGGEDTYSEMSGDTLKPHPAARNDAIWFQPDKTDSTFGFNNYGVGIDVETGIIPELLLWE